MRRGLAVLLIASAPAIALAQEGGAPDDPEPRVEERDGAPSERLAVRERRRAGDGERRDGTERELRRDRAEGDRDESERAESDRAESEREQSAEEPGRERSRPPIAREARRRSAASDEPDEQDDGERREPSIPPRPIPDYGRPRPPPDVGDALLWIPRLLFFPLHLIVEYGLRRPIGWLLRTIELERLDALFVQGVPQIGEREGQWWFVPRLRYDHGFQPTAGLVFRAHDTDRRHALRVRLEGWPTNQLAGLARGSVAIDAARLVLDVSGGYRTDRIYHGLGWSAPDWTRARYGHARGDADLFLEARPWRRSVIAGGVRAGVHRFEDSDFLQDSDRSIEDAIALGNVARPPGYPRGYTVVEPWVRVVIDSRPNSGWPHASGVRAALLGGWGVDAERGASASWARVGASLDVAIEVLRDRTLRLRGLAELVEPLAHRAIPFTEQVWLGGAMDRMPGFLLGRLIGQSAASVGISWRYAIWSWMDAELFVDTGNVFGRHFEDFELDRLRLSFGTALVTRDPDDLTLLLAFGTEPFVRGADLTSVRFAVAIGGPP